jgi:nicotinamidase-related amidase
MSLKESAGAYIDYLEHWVAGLPAVELAGLVEDPQCVAILCVDVINGFCTVGPLSSARVQGIVAPIVELFQAAHRLGVRHFVLPQDAHEPETIEFGHYPPHCMRGHIESETVPELMALPFSNEFVVIEKDSISSSEDTELDTWLNAHPQVDTFIATGDCTDLCTHQLAMHLRLRANARQTRGVRVIVPANCVQTYDTPVDVAAKLGIPPHHGDLLHAVFLFNMATNGVEVVGELC